MKKENTIFGIVLLIYCFILYYNTINTFFTGEDFDNIGYQSLDTIVKNFIFKSHKTIGHFTRGIPNTFWAVLYHLFGMNYLYYHIVNIILYWFCSFLVFKFAYQLSEYNEHKMLFSCVAAILFATLPVHAIVVNWLTLLFEKFCTIFVISAFLFWIKFKKSKKSKYFYISLILFICGLLSKEEAITFPVLIYFYDLFYYWHKGKGWKNLFINWKNYIPFFMVCAGFIPYRIYRFSGVADMTQHTSLGPELITNFINIIRMMAKPSPVWFVIILWICGLAYKNRAFYFSTIWILTVLIPVYHIPKEWRLFLASVGFCIAFSTILYDAVDRVLKNQKKAVSVIFSVMILALILLFYRDIQKTNRHWKQVTDLGKNLYVKFEKLFPDIPEGTRIYFSGLDVAEDVCSTDLFDTIVKFMYEKDAFVRNFEEFYFDLKNLKNIDHDKVQFLEYYNGKIIKRNDWKEVLLEKRWVHELHNQEDLIFDFSKYTLPELERKNPDCTFEIIDECSRIISNQKSIKFVHQTPDFSSIYINSVIIKMNLKQAEQNYCDFFWKTDDGAVKGKMKFYIDADNRYNEYKLQLGTEESWFMLDRISAFGLRIPARYADICYIKFSKELPLDSLKEKSKSNKLDSLQPIPILNTKH